VKEFTNALALSSIISFLQPIIVVMTMVMDVEMVGLGRVRLSRRRY